ncbi:MAG: PrsW family glutamic-type intramembrane protease [Pseudomonadota bacterium]
MPAASALLIVLVPVTFWAAYHYYHDRHRPEPLGHLLLCLLLGVLAYGLTKGFYAGLGYLGLRYDPYAFAAEGSYLALLVYAVAAIGLGEELCKLVPYLLVVLRFREFDEPLDGIVYGSFLALGFAVAENLHYAAFVTTTEAVARGFAGPLVHIAFASVWAYPIGRARLARRPLAIPILISLATAALLHGIYDFIAIGFDGRSLVIAALLIVAVWLWRLRIVRTLAAQAAVTGNPAAR